MVIQPTLFPIQPRVTEIMWVHVILEEIKTHAQKQQILN